MSPVAHYASVTSKGCARHVKGSVCFHSPLKITNRRVDFHGHVPMKIHKGVGGFDLGSVLDQYGCQSGRPLMTQDMERSRVSSGCS